MTPDVRAFLDAAAERLAAAGVSSPRHDAEILVALAVGTSRAGLRGHAGPLDAGVLARASELIGRRAAREPLQHLTGVAGFRHLDLAVGPGVFVPRPETELLAGAAIDELNRLIKAGVPGPVAVDLCTGSGAVAAAMLTEAPGSRVVGVEISPSAVEFAVRNAGSLGVEVRLGDLRTAADDLAGTVHVVTANPPYIPMDAYESVEPEVRDHDPAEALWSGPDGLDAIRDVEHVASRLLVDRGLVVCEHADVQASSAPAVFAATRCWTEVRDHMDLAGRPRFTTARRVARADVPAGTIGV